MELSEAIPILILGFMALIGFWLAELTYLIFKHQKQESEKELEKESEEDKGEETNEDKQLAQAE